MTQVDEALLNRMVTAIVDEVDAEQVILFGSHARGNAQTDSDADLVVIEAEPFGPGRACLQQTAALRSPPCPSVDSTAKIRADRSRDGAA